ncbi:ABC transporter substrate-binding protein [Variovorax sp. PBL-E5]|uniref:ABC transporter substrate-binding protein n=1 Tax=Variovorax sp. PBL-E5 TaxID=434014 RepID=UPI001317E5BB|nr:ABC transporter substrate-binding protein [Variovorax sp. PBL-E5]VTU45258.1 Leu/Ile/Val-binding protein precursor [Variovorax sp. PBL-E5]
MNFQKSSARRAVRCWAAASAWALSGLCAAQAPSTVPGVTADSILIGANATITGPLAAAGGVIYPTIDAYFKKTNDEGGINGRKLKFVYYDDAYDPSKTVGVAKKLVEVDKVFMMNTLGAGTTAAIADYLAERNVPVVPAITGSKKLLAYKNIFQMYPDYGTDGKTLARYAIDKLHAKSVAIWYQNDDFGKDEVAAVTEELKKDKMQPVVALPYNPTDMDFSSSVLKLKAANPDVVILAPAQKPAAQFLKDAAKLGLKTQFLVSYAAADISVSNLAGPAAEGVIFSSYQKTLVAEPNDPKMKELKEFAAKYLPGKEVSHYMFLGTYVAQLTVEALKRAGPDLTREKVIKAMEEMKDWNGAWIVDNVSYGPDQHGLGATAMYFMKIQNGKFVKVQ